MKKKLFIPLAAAIILLFIGLGERTLENIDYLKYAEVAREILETKDWVVLHENGEIYVDKPPLHFWKIALSYKAFGVKPFSARLPSAIFAAIAGLAAFLLVRKVLSDDEAAILSALSLLSSYGFFFFSQRTRIDIEFSTLFFISLVFFFLGALKDDWKLYAGFWLFTGMAFMDKGPAAFLNIPPALVYWAASWKKGLPRLTPKKFILTLPLFLIPTLPWAISLLHHPDFNRYLEKLKGTKIMTREAGILYYFPELFLKFSPSIVFLPLAFRINPKNEREKALLTFILSYAATYFILINLTKVKNHRYLLPMFPPLSILVGWGIKSALFEGRWSRFLKALPRVFVSLSVISFAALPMVSLRYGLYHKTIPAALIGLILLAFLVKHTEPKLALVFLSAMLIYRCLDLAQSLRNLEASDYFRGYRIISSLGVEPKDVVVYGNCGHLREVMSFYLNHLVKCTVDERDLKNYAVAVLASKDFTESLKSYKTFFVKDHKKKGRDYYIVVLKERKKERKKRVRDSFSFSDEEAKALSSLKDFRVSSGAAEELLNYITSLKGSEKALKPYLTGEKNLSHLKNKITEHLNRLFKDPLSKEVEDEARKIGEIHAKANVEIGAFLDAFGFMASLLFKELRTTMEDATCQEMRPVVSAFFKILAKEASLLIKSYFNALQRDLEVSFREIKSLNRIYEILRHINQLIFNERASYKNLFTEACEILCKKGDFSLAWVGEPRPNGDIIPIAAFGGTEYLENKLNLLATKEASEDLKTVLGGKPVIVQDIASYKGISRERREKAISMGFRSVIALPILLEDEVKAILFIYNKEPSFFTNREIQLLTEVSKDISVGWSNIEKGKKIEKMLFEDSLTGLKNERYLVQALKHEIDVAKSGDIPLALIRLDVDNFSLINHSFGYAAGDLVLREVGRRIKELKENVGTVARTGPDDFAFSCFLRREGEIQRVLFRLREAISQPVEVNGKKVRLTASAGVSFYPWDADEAEMLLKSATVALRRAQRKAPWGLAFYTEKETKEIIERMELLERLRKGLERREFLLHYQPRVRLMDMKPVSFEALLRWMSPEEGLVPPGKFISTLEDSGLMVDVGRWVMEESARFMKKLLDKGIRVKVSINVSTRQFSDRAFVEKLDAAVKSSGVPPELFEIEVTERVLLDAGPSSMNILEAVKKKGISISIDDFGTGFSSFLYLKRIPADTLKIDRSFVKGLPENKEDVEIVRAIVAMAKNLGKKTVAEGVEKEEQLEFLKEEGVDEAQGFLISKPLSEEKALEFLKKQLT